MVVVVHDDLLDAATIHVSDDLANTYRFLHGYLPTMNGMTDALLKDISRAVSGMYEHAEPKRI
jgi:hypothetical protein